MIGRLLSAAEGRGSSLLALSVRVRYAGFSYLGAGAVVALAAVGVLLSATPARQVLQDVAGGAVQALVTRPTPGPASAPATPAAAIPTSAPAAPSPSPTPLARESAAPVSAIRLEETPEATDTPPPAPPATPAAAAPPPPVTATPQPTARPAAPASVPPAAPAAPAAPSLPLPTVTVAATLPSPTVAVDPTVPVPLTPTVAPVQGALTAVASITHQASATPTSLPQATATASVRLGAVVGNVVGDVTHLLAPASSSPAASSQPKPSSGGLLSTITHL